MRHLLPRGMVESSVRNVYGNPDKVTPELVDRYYDLSLREGNRAALGERFRQTVGCPCRSDQADPCPDLDCVGATRIAPFHRSMPSSFSVTFPAASWSCFLAWAMCRMKKMQPRPWLP